MPCCWLRWCCWSFHSSSLPMAVTTVNRSWPLTNLEDCVVIRFGQIIGVDPTQFEKYKKYHAAVWPEVLAMIKACNISNYSIYHRDGQLFAYMEYTGSDFAADMAKM